MTELDLGLKVKTRKLFWSWGYTTKIDVLLRSVVGESKSAASGIESSTDLDVLALMVGTDLTFRVGVADCKTSQKRSTERMFWLRGIAEYFGADDALLIREKEVTRVARVVAARLHLAIATSEDLDALLSSTNSGGDPDLLSLLFDPNRIEEYFKALTALDPKLRTLLDYLRADYWTIDEHRNIQQLVAHVESVSGDLDPRIRVHASLFVHATWSLMLSITQAVQHVRRVHLTGRDRLLRAYLFGGPGGLRDKENLAAALRQATGRPQPLSPDEDVLPPYFGQLLELITRFTLKPDKMQDGLRYLEWLTEAIIAGERSSVATAFGDEYDDVAAKLVIDVGRMLVSATGANSLFGDGLARRLDSSTKAAEEASDRLF